MGDAGDRGIFREKGSDSVDSCGNYVRFLRSEDWRTTSVGSRTIRLGLRGFFALNRVKSSSAARTPMRSLW